MKKKIKIGIVGAGYIAEEHLKVFANIPNVEITGIFSRTYKKCIHIK